MNIEEIQDAVADHYTMLDDVVVKPFGKTDDSNTFMLTAVFKEKGYRCVIGCTPRYSETMGGNVASLVPGAIDGMWVEAERDYRTHLYKLSQLAALGVCGPLALPRSEQEISIMLEAGFDVRRGVSDVPEPEIGDDGLPVI